MKKCYRCKTSALKGFKYCRKCGCSFGVKYCAKGHVNPIGTLYCHICGSSKLSRSDGGGAFNEKAFAFYLGGGLVSLVFGLVVGLVLLAKAEDIPPGDVMATAGIVFGGVLRFFSF